jgi:PPOX class probable F420-dependent enzyme
VLTSWHAKRSPIMPVTLPQSVKTLLSDKAYGHVVTSNSDGKPQVTMVWMDVDGDEVLFNTAEGRRKAQNLRQDPRIIVSVQSRSDPQAYAVFHGKARITETGADENIDKLAKRFMGVDKYPFRQPGEKRVLVRISVDRIGGFGPKMQPWS